MRINHAVHVVGLLRLAVAVHSQALKNRSSDAAWKPSSMTFPSDTTASGTNVATDIASYLSCFSEVTAYYNSSRTYWLSRQTPPSLATVVTCTPHATLTTWTTPDPVTTGTKYITLCDGIPRQVGRVTIITYPPYEVTYTQQATCYTVASEANFPTSSPTCKGNCMAISSYYQAHGSSMDYGVCTEAMGDGPNCGLCVLTGKSARLLYWPRSTTPGSGNMCTEGSLLDATPTDAGPNSFVTGGLTLTSPTVGLALTGVGREDGCFQTIAETILPFHPDAITSVRGFRAWYSDWAFNYTDLNVECVDNSTDPDDCYTAVPVTPYFYGLSRDATLDLGEVTTTFDRTIYNDYRPVIAPPYTLTELFASIFGPGCMIQVDGVWDPPTALQPQTAVATASLPAFATQAVTSTEMAVPSAPMQASPGEPSLQLVAVTATATATAAADEGTPNSWVVPTPLYSLSASSSPSSLPEEVTQAIISTLSDGFDIAESIAGEVISIGSAELPPDLNSPSYLPHSSDDSTATDAAPTLHFSVSGTTRWPTRTTTDLTASGRAAIATSLSAAEATITIATSVSIASRHAEMRDVGWYATVVVIIVVGFAMHGA